MKQFLKNIAALSAAVSLVFCFGGCIRHTTDEETTAHEIAGNGNEAETDYKTGIFTPEDLTYENETESESEEETEEPSEEETEEPSEEPSDSPAAAPAGTYTAGYTSKGYEIRVIDGVTYINGVLIANKTYALPDSYYPGDLTYECSSAFASMKEAAAKEGLSIYAASGFRSYSTQESIYNRYCAEDGQAAADTYSARPGHSEHQTGLAIDLNDISSSFANTAEGQWVAENCWKYGFILRYPAADVDKTGYMYEPWHIRYVGEAAADSIFHSGLCLEEYFGITSAYGDHEVG